MTIDHPFNGSQACLGKPLAWFFPGQGRSALRAKAICATCPLIFDCLEYALTVPLPGGTWVDGIFGGTSPEERKTIRDQRGIERTVPQRSPSRHRERTPIVHGESGGAAKHRRRGEDPCDKCRNAAAAESRQQRRNRKKRAA